MGNGGFKFRVRLGRQSKLCASYWDQDPYEQEWCLCSGTLSSSYHNPPPISPMVVSVPFRHNNPSGLGSSTILMLLGFDVCLLWVSTAFSLSILPWCHIFFLLLFTTLPDIDMDFEELSILTTKKSHKKKWSRWIIHKTLMIFTREA